METGRIITVIAKCFIRFYQLAFAGRPRRCRFYPTCSDYAMQALTSKGFLRGSFMTAQRLLKCHPFHPGGYDPIQI